VTWCQAVNSKDYQHLIDGVSHAAGSRAAQFLSLLMMGQRAAMYVLATTCNSDTSFTFLYRFISTIQTLTAN
jgi:hypothetical protein